jgi:hypothetical protein
MLLVLLACKPEPSPAPPAPAPDLTDRLGPGEVRAGVVTDAASLFGGISAEGDVGDFLIYNDRVRYLIQAPGDSSYYVEYGGNLIDADLVREDGEPGRDVLDESTPMVGLGRIVDAETVTVLADGADGAATLRVEGPAAPMTLLTGALENPDLVGDLSLRVRTDYTLLPDSYAMFATTTVWNDEDEAVSLAIGEVTLLALDATASWRPGTGFGDAGSDAVSSVAVLGHENEVAFGILGDTSDLESGTVGELLSSAAPVIVGFGPGEIIEAGGEATWSRWLGVAPDIATLTSERALRTDPTTPVMSGTVNDGLNPVAGARVHILDDAGAPLTVALSGPDGAWSANVAGAASAVASGRGRGIRVDLPAGHGWVSPYEPDPATTLASLSDGATPIAFADGYGFTAPALGTLSLTAPGTLRIDVTDGGAAVARVYFASGDPVTADSRLVPSRPGPAVVGFIRDGSMTLPLEPGDYRVVVYRGVRDELATGTATVTSGAESTFTADIQPAYTLEGVYTIDPHAHASPSGDGGLPMADRLLVTAANGIDIHVGTDHDHIADYRPLLAPMGLDDRLVSVVADEVSPVLRGHFNIWPAAQTDAENGGAPRWWLGYADTAEIFGWMRAIVGADGVVQANHPVGSSGMFSHASYDANGSVADADHWSADFDAMELLNSGDYVENFPYFLDLVNRGKQVTPVGVSDSHTHTSGGVGLNLTFLDIGGAFSDIDDDALRAAMARRATVVSHGPYIDARIDGTWAPGAEVGPGTLSVDVKAPSWMPVETVTLYENGAVLATEPCVGTAPTPCSVTWALDPAADAVYVVIAASTAGMTDAHPGERAWAATSAIYVDADGGGWTSPLPAIEVE